MICHIVSEKDYHSQTDENKYEPKSIEEIGFVHCTLNPVANDYYENVGERLLLLRIEPTKLKSQTKYEAAIPEKGVNTAHVSSSSMFPHVYGPIDNSAIDGIGILVKGTSGYIWPKEFISIEAYLGTEEH